MDAKDVSVKMYDKNFRKEFIRDANTCIEKYFGETVNADIVVKKNTKDVFYVVIPYVSAEHTLNQLGNIQAAGADIFGTIKGFFVLLGASFNIIGRG